jgi:SAM-dependent methyltransferase
MMDDLETTYDRIAADWHRDHQSDTWWVEGTDEFISRLPKGGSVLDVGCGSGVKSAYLINHGLSVVGIDLSENLLTIARSVAPEAEFTHLSMTDLETLESEYDGVFAQASLLHIPKIAASDVVQKMADRIKPGGCLYLAVKEARDGKPEEALEKEDDYGYEYERFFSYYRMPELEGYLHDACAKPVWRSRTPHPSGKVVWLQVIAQK